MAAPAPDKKGLSATWAVREVDHLFGRVSHYTRFVGYSKWLLGLIAFLLLGSLIGYPLLTKDRSGIRMSFVDSNTKGQAPAQQAVSPVMNNPEYRGITDQSEPYQIDGIKATQVNPTLMVVDEVKGQLLKKDGGWVTLTADRADYHQDVKMIELFGNVTLINNLGYTFVTAHATVNANNSDVDGDQPVQGVGPTGNLLASSFQIRDNLNHIIFFSGGTQQVHLHIERAKKPS